MFYRVTLRVQVDKGVDGTVTSTVLMGVRYVPLTSREHQERMG